MTVFDYLALFLLVCSSLIGILRGLVKEIISLTGWILAFVVANAYGADLARLLPAFIPGDAVRLLVGFVALLVLCKLLAALLGRALDALIEAGGLTMADSGLGALFGLARGVLIVLALVFLAGMTALPQQPFWQQSKSAPFAVSAVTALMPWLPSRLTEHVHFQGDSLNTPE